MPANEASLDITDGYRRRLLAIRLFTSRSARASFARLDPTNLDASYAVWQEGAAALLGAGKRRSAGLSRLYLAAYVASESGRRVALPALDADSYAEIDRSGRPVRQALAAPLYTIKIRTAQGADWRTALTSGAARMTRTVVGETMAASRFALSDMMSASDDVIGWQRVTAGDACGACLAAATGAIRADDDVPEAHDACKCVAEPVVRGARQSINRPTGEELFMGMSATEQAALFRGRGGEEKARLVREGEVPFSALLQHSPRETQADGITEAPLSALLAG